MNGSSVLGPRSSARTSAMCGVLLAACAGSPAPVSPPPTTPPPAPPADAAPAPVATVDAAPAIPDELASAPAYVFRFSSPQRHETWTLRTAGDRAMLVVEAATTTTYLGSAAGGKIEVSTASAKQSLDCTHDQLAASAKCGDAKAGKVDVLSCKVPGYDTPMPFGQPGIEYVADPGCTGYRVMP